jgi:hypothetical protein
VLGLFIKRAPGWAGWSTVVVTQIGSVIKHFVLTSEFAAHHFGFIATDKNAYYWDFLSGTLVNIAVGCAWFCGSCLFADARPIDEKDRVNAFFKTLQTPVDFEKEEGPGSDNLQAKVMGILCMIYGGFILLLILIPNPWTGRIAFAFCGLMMLGIGIGLYLGSKGRRATTEALARAIDVETPA